MIISMDMTENKLRKKINTKTEEKNNIYTFYRHFKHQRNIKFGINYKIMSL